MSDVSSRDDSDSTSDASTKDGRLGRRKLLAAVVTGTTALIGGGTALIRELGTESSTPERTPDSPERPPDPPDEPVAGENIVDYGAEPNPTDPDPERAATNLSALRDAAVAAGRNGTVYVPTGTYYIGHDGSGPNRLIAFGGREPAGISIVGDGPADSILAITEHMPDDQNHSALYWWEGYDHGTVEITNLRLDGNYENLGSLVDESSGARCCVIREGASGRFRFGNVYIRGWYTMGIFLTDVSGSAVHCTFEENGIALNRDTDSDVVSHHTGIRPASGNEFVFDSCYFNRCSGSAVNVGKNQGAITLRNCYGESLGSGVHKITGGSVIRNEHCYWEPNTDWLDENLPDGDREFHGRNLAHRLQKRTDTTPTYVLNNVKICSTTDQVIETRNYTGLVVEGDLIAIHDAAKKNDRDAVFRDDANGEFRDMDIGRLSVHDCSADVFSAPHASGRIDTLAYDGVHSLGVTGNLQIGTENSGGNPFEPAVPSREEVGILVGSPPGPFSSDGGVGLL